MKSLGICIGSSTVQFVCISNEGNTLSCEKGGRFDHKGKPKELLPQLIRENIDSGIDRVVITGRSFRENINLYNISEPEAIESAISYLYPSDYPDLLISLGGNNLFIYNFNKYGKIISVHTGNKCASGTGEFFLQQIKRMGLEIGDINSMADLENAYKVAGRCSVFCKSDCTHALNKGEPKKNILGGLCYMIADKIEELVKAENPGKVLVVGGGSKNKKLISILKDRYKNLELSFYSSVFEAYGAALAGLKTKKAEFKTECFDNLFLSEQTTSFTTLPDLQKAGDLLKIAKAPHGEIKDGDRCVLGLDVGSTTTKAVLIRKKNKNILSSTYLRTNGNPVLASKECYKNLYEQTKNYNYEIVGLGVTGSGRQIAALHALTKNVINEIIAHAAASAYYDSDVETIFEIGGQDAKYTSVVNSIPADYAMNEACSAGTGSFLEESAEETLNTGMTEIADYAVNAEQALNFSDQCSAFIASDINKAIQEGFSKNDILAGLVYSICMNYINRVKGARPIGRKIFMQGGVCYNRAVPLAMASLLQTEIIVPEDSGLMGAFGVGLEVIDRQNNNQTEIENFKLTDLINRKLENKKPFICAGGKEKCDLKCEISKIKINEKTHPFGGACNMFYNLRFGGQPANSENLDLVMYREKKLFEEYYKNRESGMSSDNSTKKTVGIMRSFLTHSLFPLFYNFFKELGYRVIVSELPPNDGTIKAEAAFCYPAEISHRTFLNLLEQEPDYIFMPHIINVPADDKNQPGKTCVFVQGEPYYLQSEYRKKISEKNSQILSCVLRMKDRYEDALTDIDNFSVILKVSKNKIQKAWQKGCHKQSKVETELKEKGREAIKELNSEKDNFGIVLFGRPYNAFTSDINMGIPHKVTSRGYRIIPHDMLPLEEEYSSDNMYWAMGQKILAAGDFVKNKSNLFGFLITNFSCGPDSFIIEYFRKKMKTKPSLTIELDEHTADVGVDTRIEAALDIMNMYYANSKERVDNKQEFKAAEVVLNKKPYVIDSQNKKVSLFDSRVEVLIPPMGIFAANANAATFRKAGLYARVLPNSDNASMLTGRKNASCKECLPYILTTGLFMDYLNKWKDKNKITLFLMGKSAGPCRFGQYAVAFEELIKRQKIENTALLTMSDQENTAFEIFGKDFLINSWKGIVAADVFSDIRSMLKVAAENKEEAMETFNNSWNNIISVLEGSSNKSFKEALNEAVMDLKNIPLKKSPQEVPLITLVGEIYVRSDEFSREGIIDFIENKGFAVHTAPIGEYADYCCYILKHDCDDKKLRPMQKLGLNIATHIQSKIEKGVKKTLAKTGLYNVKMNDIEKTIKSANHLIDERLMGEAILTVGVAMHDILERSCGVISIGPFGCMPSRMSEAILKKEMNIEGKKRLKKWHKKADKYIDFDNLPFLSIEVDGTPIPQHVQSNLEAFMLQAKRLHNRMYLKE